MFSSALEAEVTSKCKDPERDSHLPWQCWVPQPLQDCKDGIFDPWLCYPSFKSHPTFIFAFKTFIFQGVHLLAQARDSNVEICSEPFSQLLWWWRAQLMNIQCCYKNGSFQLLSSQQARTMSQRIWLRLWRGLCYPTSTSFVHTHSNMCRKFLDGWCKGRCFPDTLCGK